MAWASGPIIQDRKSLICLAFARSLPSLCTSSQVKEAIGSGPFNFAKDQWVPGSKAVYVKNPHYVPRPGNEPTFGSWSIDSDGVF